MADNVLDTFHRAFHPQHKKEKTLVHLRAFQRTVGRTDEKKTVSLTEKKKRVTMSE